jgi:hypothetical protein
VLLDDERVAGELGDVVVESEKRLRCSVAVSSVVTSLPLAARSSAEANAIRISFEPRFLRMIACLPF